MKKLTFPHTVRRGGTAVKVYQVNRKDGAVVYTVASYHGGCRKTRQFRDLDRALSAARLVCDQINAGKLDVAAGLTVEDVEVLAAAREICEGRPILTVLTEHQHARKLVGDDLMEACRSWAARNAGGIKKVEFPEAVDRFYNAKLRAGIKAEGYERMLPRMKKHFEKRPVSTISSTELEAMIHREFATEGNEMAHPATYNSARKKLVSMFRWLRKQGCLPAERQTEPERLDTAKEEELVPGIIRSAQLARILQLISGEYPELLGVTVLAAFAGMRRSEIHAQTWDDIDLDRALLRITSGKRGTPARRLVPLSDAAVAWLLTCDRTKDDEAKDDETKNRVSPTNYAFDAVRRVIIEAGIDLPDNCFRHGWISHRVAQTQDIAKVSLEAGNSPDVIRRHYLELVGKEEGEEWFALSPDQVAKINGELVAYG